MEGATVITKNIMQLLLTSSRSDTSLYYKSVLCAGPLPITDRHRNLSESDFAGLRTYHHSVLPSVHSHRIVTAQEAGKRRTSPDHNPK